MREADIDLRLFDYYLNLIDKQSSLLKNNSDTKKAQESSTVKHTLRETTKDRSSRESNSVSETHNS